MSNFVDVIGYFGEVALKCSEYLIMATWCSSVALREGRPIFELVYIT